MAFNKEGSKFSPRSSSHSGPRSGSRPSSPGAFGRDSEKSPRFGSRDKPSFERGPRSFAGKPQNELTDAVCEKCGQDCKVPFKPMNGKPVYCSDCFSKNDDHTARKPRAFGSSAGLSSGISENDLQEINRKLDKIMRALDIK